MPPRDPDDNLVVVFKNIATQNEALSLQEGRPIFEDVEVCEIRAPGMKDVKVYPATALSTQWLNDPETGSQRQISYAERFSHQFRQWRAKQAQTITGTPLDQAPFLSEARRAELRAQHVYTVEQLAAIDGAELKNLGTGGREFKNQAAAFIEESRQGAPNKQLLAELEAMRAKNEVLEEDLFRIRKDKERREVEFEDMSDDKLREYITANTGREPYGVVPRKTLKRMAMEATAKERA